MLLRTPEALDNRVWMPTMGVWPKRLRVVCLHHSSSYSSGRLVAMEEARRRSFSDAIEALNGLITKRRGAGDSDHRDQWESHLQLVAKHLQLLGLEEPLSKLSVIHVAGTKGKGSTCAFVERILRASGFRTALFTSPHLLDIRERFRLNGEEISEELFTKHFWWCWDNLEANGEKHGLGMPRLFRFLAILAIKIFTSENVDVAILEVGLGGRCDATNVVKSPTVCGVTSLGYDHMELLGNTLTEIAGEKAGIFKAGVPAVTVPQVPEAMEALEKKARELQISLEVCPPLSAFNLDQLELGLKGEHQRMNAALAVALCRHWAKRARHEEHSFMLEEAIRNGTLPDTYVTGLAETEWAGRAQVIHDFSGKSNISFYLDGAHSPESMEACAKWFASAAKTDAGKEQSTVYQNGCTADVSAYTIKKSHLPASPSHLSRQVLLFNCMPKRDPRLLLPPVINLCSQQDFPIHLACFVPPYSSYTSINSYNEADEPDLSWQKVLQDHWEGLASPAPEATKVHAEFLAALKNADDLDISRYKSCRLGASSVVMPSLPVAINWLRLCSSQNPALRLQVLVTGSLYLVADVLKLLKR